MAETQSVTSRNPAEAGRHAERPGEASALLRPPVDIYEDSDGITIEADMPGVSRERLNVQVDKNNLIIEGDAQIDVPSDMSPLYADVRATHYYRAFTLSSELEHEKIDASLKDGQLVVRIPKRAHLKPRKIEVRV